MLYRESPNHEHELLLSFHYLNSFNPIEHREDFHIRKSNDKNIPLEIEDKKSIYVGENSVSFETNDKLVKLSSELGFNDNPICLQREKHLLYVSWKRCHY